MKINKNKYPSRVDFKIHLLFIVLTFPSILLAHQESHFPEILDATAMKDGRNKHAAVNPCIDFYQFSCGSWLEEAKIPSDRGAISRQVTPMDDGTDIQLNKILETYGHSDFSISTPSAEKLRDFYLGCMNSTENAEQSLQWLKSEITKIQENHSNHDLAKIIAQLHLNGTDALFLFTSTKDFNDATRIIGDAGQGGISLTEPSFYITDHPNEKFQETLNTYQEHIMRIFLLLGENQANAHKISQSILKFETDLASRAYKLADRQDADKINHRLNRGGLIKLTPHFDWDTYFSELNLSDLTEINIDEPEFFEHLDQILTSTSQEDLNHYLIWQLAKRSAPKMGPEFEKESFSFWDTYLNGVKEMMPKWKKCTQSAQASMGYALAEAYVQTFDGKKIKSKAEEMIIQIKQAFSYELQSVSTGADPWMDQKTETFAQDKLNHISQKVGAPEKWQNYDALELTPTDYLKNSLNIAIFENHRELAKIGQPVDLSEWGMMPWEVNAYYEPSNNEFNFPFGILQPPSLDLKASDGANFGSFGGGTIGHELIHGFDNDGRKFDSYGNLKDWWTQETLDQFLLRTTCYINQGNNYKIEEVKMNIDGQQILNENLADQGGVKLGYVALDSILKHRSQAPLWSEKFTERQQYWIAYAQSWCTKYTPESLRHQLMTNEHPPAEFRVNAVLMNRPEFARDFGCSVGQPMAPATRCSMW